MRERDRYDLQRFVDAQRSYAQVVAELKAGHKQSHWIWYIFPQLDGLGSSFMAQRYAISGLDEAKAYDAHPLLGERLRECTRLVTAAGAERIEDVLGFPDNLKFHSSMTLFAHAANDNAVFKDALNKYYRGEYDPLTMAGLKG
ncbi:MAG TPA: DUF1810 domain-containing protein [Steroidobacteraceae bacterium]|jgi:uncharacterized protein (DUF1810 family)